MSISNRRTTCSRSGFVLDAVLPGEALALVEHRQRTLDVHRIPRVVQDADGVQLVEEDPALEAEWEVRTGRGTR